MQANVVLQLLFSSDSVGKTSLNHLYACDCTSHDSRVACLNKSNSKYGLLINLTRAEAERGPVKREDGTFAKGVFWYDDRNKYINPADSADELEFCSDDGSSDGQIAETLDSPELRVIYLCPETWERAFHVPAEASLQDWRDGTEELDLGDSIDTFHEIISGVLLHELCHLITDGQSKSSSHSLLIRKANIL